MTGMPEPAALRLPDGRTLSFERARIMGVLNITPDSFSDGGLYREPGDAADQACRLVEAGADLLDLGAESTRPGSLPIPPEEQLRRLLPVLERVLTVTDAPVSIDTTSSEVARRCLELGAHIINDVSAFGFDSGMIALLAETGVPGIAMHTGGRPVSMQDDPRYEDVVGEVGEHLSARVEACVRGGMASEQIVLDPGIGFGKTLGHNLRLIAGLPELVKLGHAVLVGPSRKRFLGEVTGRPVGDRERGTAAACAMAIQGGAHMVRVHDPAAALDAVRLGEAVALAATALPSGVDFQWPPT